MKFTLVIGAVLAGFVPITTCLPLPKDSTQRSALELVEGNLLPEPVAGYDWVKVAEFSDEFDGKKLDAAKWGLGNPEGWKGHAPAEFRDENVALRDGNLEIQAHVNDDDAVRFTTGSIHSLGRIRYGYFEARCKVMNSRASSAFWFFHHTPEHWTELDVFELCDSPEHGGKLYTNARLFHDEAHPPKTAGGDPVQVDHPHSVQTGLDLSAEFHTYGMKWDAEWVSFYFDGKLVRSVSNKHWDHPLHLIFDSEVFEKWFGLPTSDELPATFKIDYVRTWQLQEVKPSASAGAATSVPTKLKEPS